MIDLTQKSATWLMHNMLVRLVSNHSGDVKLRYLEVGFSQECLQGVRREKEGRNSGYKT